MEKRVALIVETSSSYGREILSGIVRHMRIHGNWSVFLEQRDIDRKPPNWLAGWDGDGIISRTTTPELSAAVVASGIPFVELTDRHEESRKASVRSDDRAIGKMAAEHLLERGFERYGFCGFEGEAWSQRRQFGFVEAIEKAGMSVSIFNTPWRIDNERSWDQEQEIITTWLKQIQRPFGIMACNDVRGKHVLDAASDVGLAVPEDIAVIGVDDDQLLCQVCTPPLSSVTPNASAIGYQGAELLASLMNQPTGAADPTLLKLNLVQPIGVVARQSTDVVAIEDQEVAAALAFIRKNACIRRISVDDVLQNVAISRTSLERKLRKYIGRSPQQEIRHVQIKKVKQLLTSTNLAAERIATVCGFEHPEYMHVVFKRVTGETIGEFRRKAGR